MRSECPFCQPMESIALNNLAFAIFDQYPVNEGHVLIIPKRHVADFFDLSNEEKQAILSLLDESRDLLVRKYSPDGFNVGINCGKAAGQTVFHVHVHLIPRYTGDVANPTGGVRGVIPEKRIYLPRD